MYKFKCLSCLVEEATYHFSLAAPGIESKLPACWTILLPPPIATKSPGCCFTGLSYSAALISANGGPDYVDIDSGSDTSSSYTRE